MSSNFPITKKRKVDKFMEPTNTFTYYEDLYGRRNREELDEGPIDSCNSDSDEEITRKPSNEPAPDRFFRKYTTPKNKSNPSGSDYFGVIRTPAKQTTTSTFPPSAADSNIEGSPSKLPRAFSSKKTKLMPRKYGIFGAPTAPDMGGEPNSAGEFLDDIERDRNERAYFKTLEPESASGEEELRKDTPMSEPVDSQVQFPRNPYEVDQRTEPGVNDIYDESLEVEENAEIRSASDGDIEDNDSELNEELKNEVRSLRSRQPRGGAKKPTMAVKKAPPAKPKYSLRKKALNRAAATSSDAGTPRRSSRHLKAETVQSANRGVGRSWATKATELAVSNRSKMTARATARRTRAKRANPEEEYYQAVYGRKSKGKKKQEMNDTTDEKEDYYRAVYGRKPKANAEDILEQYDYEPEYTDVIPSKVAKVMEKMGGWVDVDVVEAEDVDEYERMF